jgi:hypothetical protein
MTLEPAFVTVALLYAKTSRAGKPLLFGRVGELRLYAFKTESRVSKDCAPEYKLMIRFEDYQRLKDKLPAALAVKAREDSED